MNELMVRDSENFRKVFRSLKQDVTSCTTDNSMFFLRINVREKTERIVRNSSYRIVVRNFIREALRNG